jgi:hypothetical protein
MADYANHPPAEGNKVEHLLHDLLREADKVEPSVCCTGVTLDEQRARRNFEKEAVAAIQQERFDDMKKLLLGYRDNMRVELESRVAVTAKTVADLRALTTWPEGLVLDIHVDLDPRLSVVTVKRAS